MLYFFTGTDREKVRSAMSAEVERVAKKADAEVLRITDANTADDLRMALRGRGMFGTARIIVLEGILANEDMQSFFMEELSRLAKSEEPVFLYEEKPLADVRRKIEKHAERSTRHDAAKKERDNSIFALASALQRGDRKTAWVLYQTALLKGDAPEALHGILFWGAKKMLLSGRKGSSEQASGARLVAQLAELPHEARRKGVELEYALERFLLSVNKV